MTTLIGLLGGTFDPVHNGHLAIARAACIDLHMYRVHLILNAVPPHRTPPVCPVDHRLSMLRAAVEADPRLVPDTRELERTGPSYTLWTLRSLRREFPEASLCWIVGVDAWMGMTSWYRWYELSSLANFVVVKRPGWTLSGVQAAGLSTDATSLKRHNAGAKVLVEGPGVDVSASDVRARIARRGDVEALLPAPVWEHIKRERLYGYPQSVA